MVANLKRGVKVIDTKERKEGRGQDLDWGISLLDDGRVSWTLAKVLEKWESS